MYVCKDKTEMVAVMIEAMIRISAGTKQPIPKTFVLPPPLMTITLFSNVHNIYYDASDPDDPTGANNTITVGSSIMSGEICDRTKFVDVIVENNTPFLPEEQ